MATTSCIDFRFGDDFLYVFRFRNRVSFYIMRGLYLVSLCLVVPRITFGISLSEQEKMISSEGNKVSSADKVIQSLKRRRTKSDFFFEELGAKSFLTHQKELGDANKGKVLAAMHRVVVAIWTRPRERAFGVAELVQHVLTFFFKGSPSMIFLFPTLSKASFQQREEGKLRERGEPVEHAAGKGITPAIREAREKRVEHAAGKGITPAIREAREKRVEHAAGKGITPAIREAREQRQTCQTEHPCYDYGSATDEKCKTKHAPTGMIMTRQMLCKKIHSYHIQWALGSCILALFSPLGQIHSYTCNSPTKRACCCSKNATTKFGNHTCTRAPKGPQSSARGGVPAVWWSLLIWGSFLVL